MVRRRVAIPKNFRTEVWKRDNGVCQYCGHPLDFEGFEIDHVVPTSRGGPNVIENMRLSCFSCNSSKRAHDIEAIRRSLARGYIEEAVSAIRSFAPLTDQSQIAAEIVEKLRILIRSLRSTSVLFYFEYGTHTHYDI